MPRRKISEENKVRLEQKNKVIQDLVALSLQWAEEDGDEVVEIIKRTNQSPPPQPEISKYNPDGIVDIITFCTHPYFLGQTLHPFQSLALKLFYLGTEGNQNLSISELKQTKGCEGCVWKYSMDSECNSAEQWKNNIPQKAILPVENSPCLTCSRFDKELKDFRFNYLKHGAKTLNEERKYDRLEKLPVFDRYTTESDLLSNPDFDQEIRKQVENKLGNKFGELVLVCGRRSGKSLIVSIIALYEAYRLLSMKHPQARYNLLEFDEIMILNVAKNEEQAKKAIFSKIKSLCLTCPYFEDKLGYDTELELKFLTEHDMQENKRRQQVGISQIQGTIIIRCGHSNAPGLVGLTNWIVILDELAAMVGENPESGVDYKLYEDLGPSVATFGDDGKILTLSNPKGPHGLLYDLYEGRRTDPTTLILQLPTWLMNQSISMDWLEAQKAKDPIEYDMQYGAKFGEASEDPFLDPDVVDQAFYGRPQARLEEGGRLFRYFCHVDPATTSDYYALVVAHLVPNNIPKGPPAVFIDHIHYWEPIGKNKPVNSDEVEKYIIDLQLKFRFEQVTFDQWNSQTAITHLRNAGIKAECKQFNKKYCEMIYGTLYDLLAENRIFIYNINTEYRKLNGKVVSLQEIDKAKQQLKMLQKKWKGKNYKIEALSGYNDDIPDCIAAAAYECLSSKLNTAPLPKPRTVYAGR